AASSLIGDLVRPERRARAMSIFMLGLPIGLALGFFISGWVTQDRSWREAFLVAGYPGLALAFAALFILEPKRGATEPHLRKQEILPFAKVLRHVLSRPTMWWIIASGALHNFNMYALGTFIASFLYRYHRLDFKQAGMMSGLIYGCGALGIFAAGW